MSESDGSETDDSLDPATQRRVVRERYGRIAKESGDDSDDSCSSDGCCGDGGGTGDVDRDETAETAQQMGYSADDIAAVSGDANLGLGCGNPNALASLEAGETVLDLGSGAGFDCFLAAQEVGEDGHVIGVDMTPAMVETARDNAAENDGDVVEFRLGEIEHLPVADGSVDVVVSNCVVNLSPDKARVFREAFRALRPGGRLAISDVVLTADVPDGVRADPDSVAGCVAGAATVDRIEQLLREAGFEDVDVSPKADSDRFVREWDDEYDVSDFVVSAEITGRKPEIADE